MKYGLGYAPPGWDNLRKFLRGKGFSDEQMIAAAVASKGRNGSCYDMFRNRVIFPIIDLKKNVIGFGGRVLDDSNPSTSIPLTHRCSKRAKISFSLNFAKNHISDSRLILAEGYMDVIAVNQAGFENVVATLGTALTSEQARLISSYAKEVVIAYDSDGAGAHRHKPGGGAFGRSGGTDENPQHERGQRIRTSTSKSSEPRGLKFF